MTNLLQHPQFGEIRVEKVGEEFLFCAKDVCDALGMNQKVDSALRGLDEDEKLILKISVSGQHRGPEKPDSGQNRDMLFVTESGLYALVIRSNKPAARGFRKWITSEVLPALRKYGVYSVDVKVTGRAEKKAEDRAVKALLGAVSRELSETDRRLVAKQRMTSGHEVWRVLEGQKEDARMLALLYARATGNKLLRNSFYTQEGAERLLAALNSNEAARLKKR
jgi:prophage antirepressor-like protein